MNSFLDKTHIYGNLAIIIGIISFIPIILKMFETKDTNNFTWTNLFLAVLSNIMWILYGSSIGSESVIISGVLYLLIYVFICFIKFMH
jgi:uncharacterized protein with PQ loop repeat